MYPTAPDLAGRSLPMITIHLEKRCDPSTGRSCFTAPPIEQALRLAGVGARVVFPIDGEAYFDSADYPYPRLTACQVHPRPHAS
jgi:hypothetical protein